MAKHPVREKQDWSRVYYSIKLHIPSWLPGLVVGYLNKKALREVRGNHGNDGAASGIESRIEAAESLGLFVSYFVTKSKLLFSGFEG